MRYIYSVAESHERKFNRTNVSRIYGPATEDCKLAKIRRSNDLFTASRGFVERKTAEWFGRTTGPGGRNEAGEEERMRGR